MKVEIVVKRETPDIENNLRLCFPNLKQIAESDYYIIFKCSTLNITAEQCKILSMYSSIGIIVSFYLD